MDLSSESACQYEGLVYGQDVGLVHGLVSLGNSQSFIHWQVLTQH